MSEQTIYEGQIPGAENNEFQDVKNKLRVAHLPVFTLRKGESFYIKREELKELNDAYFKLFDDIKDGMQCVPDEPRSYMESVMFESYRAEIEEMQRNNKLAGETARLEVEKKSELLTPFEWRRFFRRRSNQSMQLLDEKVRRIARKYYIEKALELPAVQPETFEEVYDELKAFVMRAVHKNSLSAMREVVKELWEAYSSWNTAVLESLFATLEILITDGIQKKKKRLAAYELLDRLIESYAREEKAKTSDITVLRLIAEILKGKPRLNELQAPQKPKEEPAVETVSETEPQEPDANAEQPEQDDYDELETYDSGEWDGRDPKSEELYHNDDDENINPEDGDNQE